MTDASDCLRKLEDDECFVIGCRREAVYRIKFRRAERGSPKCMTQVCKEHLEPQAERIGRPYVCYRMDLT